MQPLAHVRHAVRRSVYTMLDVDEGARNVESMLEGLEVRPALTYAHGIH